MEHFIKNELNITEGEEFTKLVNIGRLIEFVMRTYNSDQTTNIEELFARQAETDKKIANVIADNLRVIQFSEMNLKISTEKITEFAAKAEEELKEPQKECKLINKTVRDMFIDDGLKSVEGFALKVRGVDTDLFGFGDLIYKQAKCDMTSPQYKIPKEADTATKRTYLADLYDFIETNYEKEGLTNCKNLRTRYLKHYGDRINPPKK